MYHFLEHVIRHTCSSRIRDASSTNYNKILLLEIKRGYPLLKTYMYISQTTTGRRYICHIKNNKCNVILKIFTFIMTKSNAAACANYTVCKGFFSDKKKIQCKCI